MNNNKFNFIIGSADESGVITPFVFVNRDVMHGDIEQATTALEYANSNNHTGAALQIFKVSETIK